MNWDHLEAGSPVAEALYRLWSGERVVTYPADSDWLDLPRQLARAAWLADFKLAVTPGVRARLGATWLQMIEPDGHPVWPWWQDPAWASGKLEPHEKYRTRSNERYVRSVLVLHPRISFRRAEALCARQRASRLLIPAGWRHRDCAGELFTVDGDWQEVPLEVVLAGAPG